MNPLFPQRKPSAKRGDFQQSGCPIEGYSLTRAEPFENQHLAPGYYESLKRSYAAAFYEQEVKGAYLNVTSGRAYAAFDRAGHVRAQRYSPEAPLLWALDFNVDPMADGVGYRATRRGRRLASLGRDRYATSDDD